MCECKICGGTGETRHGSGVFDCSESGCNAAVERTALEESLHGIEYFHPSDALWIGYQAGKAAMLKQANTDLAAKDDGVWANTVRLK